jgi:hypothetical protein
VRNYSHRSSRFGWVLLTTAFEKPYAGRADEVEQRHPYEEQGDDGDSNDEGNDIVRHNFLRDLAVEAVDRSGSLSRMEGAGISSKIWLGIDGSANSSSRGVSDPRTRPGLSRAMGCSDNCSMAQVATGVYE